MINQVKGINTSNPGKMAEYERFLGRDLDQSTVDLAEPQADPDTVAVYKASQVDSGVLVEDTSLDVEGASVGVNVKWMLDNLDTYIGHGATFTVILGLKLTFNVYLFRGDVRGTIVKPRGGGFGFDAVFQPNGSQKTLGEEKPDLFNARYLAVQKLERGRWYHVSPPINEWDGEWQHD